MPNNKLTLKIGQNTFGILAKAGKISSNLVTLTMGEKRRRERDVKMLPSNEAINGDGSLCWKRKQPQTERIQS